MLESLGLDATTTSVYRIWLRDTSLPTDQVAQQLGISGDSVDRARAALLERGLLIPSWEEPGRLVAVNPEVALERLYRERDAELARQQEQLAAARLAVTHLVQDYSESVGTRGPTDSIDQLEGIDAIRREITDLGAHMRQEMLALHPASEHTPEALEAALQLDMEAMRRGVRIRSIYADMARLDGPTLDHHRRAAQAGMEIRYAPSVPMRMLVFDRSAGIVPLHLVDTGRAALVVRGAALVAVLVLSFEQLWVSAEPFVDDTGEIVAHHEGLDPSDSDRTLLRLLSLGVKDEAAARHLGVSVRTVRRQIADLMRRLEAESRFQAGIRAAQRGWL